MRYYNNAQRYGDLSAKRTQPPPNLPPGVAHKLSENYYYTRDVRREVGPPVEVYRPGPKMLTQGESSASSAPPPYDFTPGIRHKWDAKLQRP
ncbi:unnamed protein product [Mesocestoides corti]|uniref:NADH dehydrogenase [ubiquinone] 1 alpha subcomplex subunit 7 n=1 Tax=Mesocestoides corti TaxID=53468 RepID=A0A0R3ULL8_MESCO|nr:unnamed protein product [Mesocestoides corti]